MLRKCPPEFNSIFRRQRPCPAGDRGGGSVLISWIRSRCDRTRAVAAGDALLMRPLLLHASGRSQSYGQRRVLQVEYAGFTLPEDLRWHEAA